MNEVHNDGSEGRFVSVGAVAEALGLCPQSVRNLERRGALPRADRLDPGGRRVWRLTEIEEALARVRTERAARQHGVRVSAA